MKKTILTILLVCVGASAQVQTLNQGDVIDYRVLNANYTNLLNAIAAKQAAIITGSTAQYLRGDLSLATFPTTWAWANLTGVPSTFAPSAHASTHLPGGADPISLWGSGSRAVAANALGVSGNCVSWGAAGLIDAGSPCGTGSGSGANALGSYFVAGGANAPANGINLGALSTGLLKITVSGGVASASIAVAGDIPNLSSLYIPQQGTQSPNVFYGSPNGAPGTMSPRAIVANDIPPLNYMPLPTPTAGAYARANGTSWVGSAILLADIPNLGGTYLKASATGKPAGKYCVSVDGSGNPTLVDWATCTGGSSGGTAMTWNGITMTWNGQTMTWN